MKYNLPWKVMEISIKKVWIFGVFIMILFLPNMAFAMHITEGFLPAVWAVSWGILTIPFIMVGFLSIQKTVRDNPRIKILLAMVGAFAFVLSALKIPSINGSCSHPTGVGLGAVLFGPTTMSVLGLIVLLFQAILLAHGGLTTLGANTFSMAVIGPIVAFATYKLVKKANGSQRLALFLAAFLGDLMTYITTSVQIALAFPEQNGGFVASLEKFIGIFAVTQIPLAISEGILTVLIVNAISTIGNEELKDLKIFSGGTTDKIKPQRKYGWVKNLFLLGIVVGLAVLPFFIAKDAEFGGADSQAEEAITQIDKNYKPWFSSIWKPPSKEIESLLFALQAAIGAGVIGYGLGFMRGRSKKKEGQ